MVNPHIPTEGGAPEVALRVLGAEGAAPYTPCGWILDGRGGVGW